MATTGTRAAPSAAAPPGAATVPESERTAGPRAPARDGASILARFERAELAGAACTLGDLVRELRHPDTARSADELVSLLDAYHRHLCSAYRGCPADGAAPVLAFSSFARAGRPGRNVPDAG